VKKAMPLSVKRAIAKQLTDRSEPGGILALPNGLQFERTRDRVFARLVLEGDYGPELSRITSAIVQAGDQVVDVGANFGWYSVLLSSEVGPTGHVFSFEPMEETYNRLCHNLSVSGYDDGRSTPKTLQLVHLQEWLR
jgi:hypothetical protein